jgi:hypothetical protein
MPLAAIAATMTSINAAKDIVKAIVSLNTIAEVNQKAIELQNIIIDLQGRIFEIQQSHSAIENELVEINNWEKNTANNYHLYEPYSGKFIYASNEPMKNNEPAHWICPNCYKDRIKSILQTERKDIHYHIAYCPNKKCDFKLHQTLQRETPTVMRLEYPN